MPTLRATSSSSSLISPRSTTTWMVGCDYTRGPPSTAAAGHMVRFAPSANSSHSAPLACKAAAVRRLPVSSCQQPQSLDSPLHTCNTHIHIYMKTKHPSFRHVNTVVVFLTVHRLNITRTHKFLHESSGFNCRNSGLISKRRCGTKLSGY